MHFIWNWMNFFNSIQSSSQCDIEEYHFCVWWILKEIFISFLFIQTKRHMTNVFFSSRLSSYFQPNTISNNNYFIVNFLLSTPFHLPTIWAVNHFHFWSHHRHLKSRHSLSFHPPTMTVLSTFHHKDSFKWIDYHFQSVVFNLNIFREWGRENGEGERNKLNNNMISSWIIFISTWWKLWIFITEFIQFAEW